MKKFNIKNTCLALVSLLIAWPAYSSEEMTRENLYDSLYEVTVDPLPEFKRMTFFLEEDGSKLAQGEMIFPAFPKEDEYSKPVLVFSVGDVDTINGTLYEVYLTCKGGDNYKMIVSISHKGEQIDLSTTALEGDEGFGLIDRHDLKFKYSFMVDDPVKETSSS
ncbi:MAG: hypothetical protein IBX55_00600 [Methyloprofundus sp.]|nr:hypothetical protein [Methyloprofundus sp.]